jgi:hypothetical protein
MIQMATMMLQRLVHFLHFNTIRYERPHSKTFETPFLGEIGKDQFCKT